MLDNTQPCAREKCVRGTCAQTQGTVIYIL